MEYTRWSAGQQDGMAETEQLHPAFFAQLNELSALPDGVFALHFDRFVSNFESDLRAEEQWMEDIEFASLKEHRALHAEALTVLHQAQARSMVGDVRLARRVIELLPEWFVEHVVTMDVPLANALRVIKSQHSTTNLALNAA